MAVTVRLAGVSDVELICKLVNDLIHELGGAPLDRAEAEATCRSIVSREDEGAVLVAEDTNTMVGVCTLSFQESVRTKGVYAIVQEMYVVPEHRGLSLGEQLLRRAMSVAEERGCSIVELGTPPDGQRAERFYDKMGFKRVGLRLRAHIQKTRG